MRPAPHSAFHRQPSASTHEPSGNPGCGVAKTRSPENLAALAVVVERPDLVARAVGEIHRAPVRAPREAVRHLDAGAEDAIRAVGFHAVENAARREVGLGERADPEAPGAI